MSLTTGEMSAADLAAVVGNGNNGGWGDMGSGWWIILLFLCLFGNGGWETASAEVATATAGALSIHG